MENIMIKEEKLRKQFKALQKKHDGPDFRFLVEMLYHHEPLDNDDDGYPKALWKAANKAVDILEEAEAEYDAVFAWGMRGPNNSRAVHVEKFKASEIKRDPLFMP
jgi:hypothetical protein